MKKITVILVLLTIFAAAGVFAADEVTTGRITGKILIKDEGPMAEGTVMFFSYATGPPPLVKRYMRTPEHITDTDNAGKFSVLLPEGKYYIGGTKRSTDRWGGPPREGDFFFISRDENSNPALYVVKEGENTDAGLLTEETTDWRTIAKEGITAIEGSVLDMSGNPLEDTVVFAYAASKVFESLGFVSDYTGPDGKYLLRVHEGGTYHLMLMGAFGSVFPASGMTVSVDGKESETGVIVVTGEIKKKVDIRLTNPL